jgi:hypothetical protein
VRTRQPGNRDGAALPRAAAAALAGEASREQVSTRGAARDSANLLDMTMFSTAGCSDSPQWARCPRKAFRCLFYRVSVGRTRETDGRIDPVASRGIPQPAFAARARAARKLPSKPVRKRAPRSRSQPTESLDIQAAREARSPIAKLIYRPRSPGKPNLAIEAALEPGYRDPKLFNLLPSPGNRKGSQLFGAEATERVAKLNSRSRTTPTSFLTAPAAN